MTTAATIYRSTMPSPLGPLLLCGTATAITALFMATRKHPEEVPSDTLPDDGPFREARRQLEAYFAGELSDEQYDEKELAMALAGLPSVPEPA